MNTIQDHVDLLIKAIEDTPDDILREIMAKVDAEPHHGITIDEYLSSLSEEVGSFISFENSSATVCYHTTFSSLVDFEERSFPDFQDAIQLSKIEHIQCSVSIEASTLSGEEHPDSSYAPGNNCRSIRLAA